MKPIFNKIFNQIDKIYSEQTGMIYPVSAAVGGPGPIPPGPSSKIDVQTITMAYQGSVASFKQVWDVGCKMTFNEPEPESWDMYIVMPNVYVAEYGPDPHPVEDVRVHFNKTSTMGAYYTCTDPAWLIGDFPTTAHVTIEVDGEVWTECDVTNIINTTDNNPDYFGLVDNAITLAGNQDGTYNIAFTADNYSFSSLASGWEGYVEIPNWETYIHQYIKFDITNVTDNSQVTISNVTLDNPVNSGDYLNGYGYDADGVQNFLFSGEATVTPYVAPSFFRVENMTNDNNNVTITKNGTPSTGTDLAYSKDGRNFTTCEYTNNVCTITLGAHEKVYLRSTTGLSQSDTNYYSIGSSAAIEVAGDIKSLIDYTDGQLGTAQSYGFYKLLAGNTNGMVSAIDFSSITTLNDHCYFGMFENCTGLTVASPLPATTLAESCYEEMFKGCTALTTIPTTLPATTLTVNCYKCMFEGCTYISYIPTLPATTLASTCYEGMFRGCVRLSDLSTKQLPAIVLTNSCYREMFKGCTSMTATPDILAETLAEHCCHGMFEGCTSLSVITVPAAEVLTESCFNSMFKGCTSLEIGEVPATTLAEDSLDDMFNGCSSMNEISTQATEWNESYATNWVQGVAASGTFYNDGCADIPTGVNGIPTGWTEEKDCPEPAKFTVNSVVMNGPTSVGPYRNVYGAEIDITLNETPPTDWEQTATVVINGVCVAEMNADPYDNGNYTFTGIYDAGNHYEPNDPAWVIDNLGTATVTIYDSNSQVWAIATTDNVTLV